MIVMGGFGWSGWSGWMMGQEMVGVMSHQKIYGVNSVKRQKVEKISGSVSFGWLCWVWWVRMGYGSMVAVPWVKGRLHNL